MCFQKPTAGPAFPSLKMSQREGVLVSQPSHTSGTHSCVTCPLSNTPVWFLVS